MDMNPPDARGVAALLDALDGTEPLVVVASVRQCTDRLRSAEWGAALDRLSAKLVALAEHVSPRVRQAVAEATPYLPEAVFTKLVASLKTDKAPYVRDEAARAERRWSALRRAAEKDDESDQRVERWYAELDKHRGARRTAQRISAHEREYFVRRMYHQSATLHVPVGGALAALSAAIEEPQIDRALVRAQVAQLGKLFKQLQHIFEDGKQNAQTIEPDFREEGLRALVEEQAAVVRAGFPDRAARIAIDTREIDTRLAIEVDAKYLKEAVRNILKNAVEAYDGVGEGEEIVVRVSARPIASGTKVKIAFADRGSGMGDEDSAGAFVPFGSTKPGGTGFGLFLARKVARQLHGGDRNRSRGWAHVFHSSLCEIDRAGGC